MIAKRCKTDRTTIARKYEANLAKIANTCTISCIGIASVSQSNRTTIANEGETDRVTITRK